MQKVSVKGVDGQRSVLALVRRDERTTYVCSIERYPAVAAGDEDPVVGFPTKDVEMVG
jgi:hypothetical protein